LQNSQGELLILANYVRDERAAILLEWQRAVKRDPALSQGDSLPRAELLDHIPSLLTAFEQSLRNAPERAGSPAAAAQEPGAAHGLQRWQQGYDLREVTRELGQLNKCVILELDRYAKANRSTSLDTMSRAREVWATLCSTAIEESVTQYFVLQQREAAGHAMELEHALADIRELEQKRGDQWRQAAHDLRGNLGVVANVAVGLTRYGGSDPSQQEFVRILMRNVTSLHHLLDDVTSLARLQAGREHRQIEPLDATTILQPLCDGIGPLAKQRGLTLRCDGPPGFAIEGDAVKIRRIAQNLILNAVKYTRQGGITVTWGDSADEDPKRWSLTIQDTGPGFHSDSGQPLAEVLDPAREPLPSSEMQPEEAAPMLGHSFRGEAGEGIGLSIVKRLCELLDAQIEMQSVKDVGTTFRILFPRRYAV
jgi:signal transduction histidine kinase